MLHLITCHGRIMPPLCGALVDFRLIALFASVDISIFKDRRVHFRNSGMKGLKDKYLKNDFLLISVLA